jgi:excinuclease ABC subunit C
MRQAAAAMRFEEAESYRRRLEQLADYRSRSIIVSSITQDMDVFSLLIEGSEAYCNFVRIIGGALVNSFTVELSLGVNEDPEQVLSSAIEQIRSKISIKLADTVVVPFLPDKVLLSGIKFIVPQRGDKMELLRFGEKNIRFYRLEKMKNLEIKDPAKHTDRLLEALRRGLNMSVLPRHIECFDNSNLHGTNAVAACVVFRNGKPSKREYRHFNIKTVDGIDDFASMREVIGRRYRRLIEEGSELPDLIIVDGGKGQLSSAYMALTELGIEDKIKLAGLAKRIEEIFFPNDPEPYYLERGGEALRVMMHIRDEAHRFGITHHRNKRSKAFLESAKKITKRKTGTAAKAAR